MEHWPPLAWLAECSANDETIGVYHGTWIETKERWFCEAVWAGDFLAGDFDKTDIVSGSGARIRDNTLWFVSSASNINRLHSLRKGGTTFVSNSLICLLARVEGNCDLDYLAYSADFANYTHTVFGNHSLDFPSSAGPVEMTYVANLLWNGEELAERDKPRNTPRFNSFNDYCNFMQATMRLVASNAAHEGRSHPFKLLCPLSNGYDSPTVAALAHELSGIEAFTFNRDSHGADDSGEAIAAALGIPCHVIDRNAWRTSSLAEVPFLACSGSVGDLAYKPAEKLLRGSVMLSGYGGDIVWDKNTHPSSRLAIGDGSMLGASEYRLWAGFISCAVPFWGIRRLADIIRLSNATEMQPWDTGGDYNRPICRRIVEGSGVDRSLFGTRKRGVSVVPRLRRDYLSPTSLENLLAWLGEQAAGSRGGGFSLPGPTRARLLDRVVTLLSAVAGLFNRLRRRRGFRWLSGPLGSLNNRLTRPYYHHQYYVHWANDRAKQRYQIKQQR